MKEIPGFVNLLLILFWFNSVINKLIDYNKYKKVLIYQDFSPLITRVLFWLLPIFELTIAVLLCIRSSRLLGAYISSAVLLLTTGFLHFYARYPYARFGIFRKMSWRAQLKYYIFSTLLSSADVVLLLIVGNTNAK